MHHFLEVHHGTMECDYDNDDNNNNNNDDDDDDDDDDHDDDDDNNNKQSYRICYLFSCSSAIILLIYAS